MEQVRLQEELKKTRQELLLLYEIGNLIRTTLLLDEVIYLILSAVTSHEGLGYNRAIFFMVDEAGTQLEGKMGIGPTHPEAAPMVWKMIEENKITLEGLLDVYHKAGKKIDVELNKIVRQIRMPIEKSYGVLAKTVIHDEPRLISSAEANHELCDLRLQNLGIGQFAVVPLRGKDQVIGVLLIDNVTTKKPIDENDVRALLMLANHAGLAVENAKSYSEVMVNSQQDSLTKLWNHGHFQKLLIESIGHAKATSRPLSIIVFDVDDFKSYNDTYGHLAGDKALERISAIAKTVVRRIDDVARYGGEEFAVVLPGTTKPEALKLARRLKDVVHTQTAREAGLRRKITISAGIASYPEDAEDKDKLIFCADGALYEAKRTGKNKVCAYKKPAPQK
ncbi:MAG: sensor domain-containing diguanylate cyclase [Candidatus Omnitrophica bacterium]|nr:sensor domain-containing diguanylate cyclase [Candidatus Omnitrophota bacterium]